MASNTYELIHLCTEIYHRDWQTGPLSRPWMGTMLIFCLLATLVDVAYIFSTYSVIQLLLNSGQPGGYIQAMRIAWALIIVNWFIEMAVGFVTAIGRRGKVSALASISISNFLFTAVQYGTLPLVAFVTLTPQMTGDKPWSTVSLYPSVRCFLYLSLIQSISFCLSTYTMVIWCQQEFLRGGNLFVSVLGIPYACKMQAYMKRDKLRKNWPIILVRTIVYIFLQAVLYFTAVLLLTYLSKVPYLEQISFYIFIGFVSLAGLPFLIAQTIFMWCCICYCCCAISEAVVRR